MSRFAYTLLLWLIQPIVIIRLFIKSTKLASYRGRLLERYGFNLPRLSNTVWVHAVSVGETITAKPVIEHALAQGHTVLVTTTTPTGADQVKRLFGDRVTHRFLPQDLPWCMQRFIKAVQPSKLLIMETELWPNLIHQAHRARVPVMLVNGRLSEKSARGYQKFSKLTQPMLSKLACVAAQTATEKQRFVDLGVAEDKCIVVPSLKFDATVPATAEPQAQEWREQYQWQDRFIWIAASTHAPEEQLALSVHQRLLEQVPTALLVLVPRHPDRFEDVAQMCAKSPLTISRFTSGNPEVSSQVWLGDVMGQMWNLFALADVAFVGNSLNGGGGHNVMEPALSKRAVVTGPAMFNFTSVSQEMEAEGGLRFVDSEDSLFKNLLLLAQNPEQRQQSANAAFDVAQRNGGGLVKTLALLEQLG